jgi:hypothetical protein
MCRRFCGLLAVLLVALACTPLFAESSALASTEPFVDSQEYNKIPGWLLNQWRMDSIAQDESLRLAEEHLALADKNLLTSQVSFERYKSLRTRDEVVGAVVIGAVVAVIGHFVWR